jgi:hypothetical protein
MFIRDLSAVFVHIPKTAGNSTILKLVNVGLLTPENLTARHAAQDSVTRFGYSDEIAPSKHASAENQISRLIQLFENEPGIISKKTLQIVFTLRNPIDRLSSLALHMSNGQFSLLRIFTALTRPSVTQKVLLSDRVLLKLRAHDISIEWVVLDFDNLEASISGWLGSEWTRSRDDTTGEPMPKVNVSNSSAFNKALTRWLVRFLIYLTPSARDFKLNPGRFLGERPMA